MAETDKILCNNKNIYTNLYSDINTYMKGMIFFTRRKPINFRAIAKSYTKMKNFGNGHYHVSVNNYIYICARRKQINSAQ
jgi:hypothetical protein